MNYEIKITEHKRPLPYVVFEDEKYDLLGEFLLAERSFRRDILAAANDVDPGSEESADFSGNAFSLEINRDTCRITNDLDGRELELPTSEFKAVLLDYIYALRAIKVKEKLEKLGHDHDHHHDHHHGCDHQHDQGDENAQ